MSGAAPTTRALFTVGYQGRTLDGLVEALLAAGVTHLIDVRAVAASRKPGFSKGLLSASMLATGIGYTHLRPLGTPKPGRDAARRGDATTLHRIYAAHLDTPEAQAGLAQAASLATRTRACLLCFEADPTCCHRSIVANHLAPGAALRIEHL